MSSEIKDNQSSSGNTTCKRFLCSKEFASVVFNKVHMMSKECYKIEESTANSFLSSPSAAYSLGTYFNSPIELVNL